MIKSKKELPAGIHIDLTGPQGNAFYLLGLASKYAKVMDLDEKEVLTKMKSGDYENLVNVFESYFGGFATLYR